MNTMTDLDNNTENADKQRPIRSFVLRQGRLTKAQASALEKVMPIFGIAYNPQQLDLNAIF